MPPIRDNILSVESIPETPACKYTKQILGNVFEQMQINILREDFNDKGEPFCWDLFTARDKAEAASDPEAPIRDYGVFTTNANVLRFLVHDELITDDNGCATEVATIASINGKAVPFVTPVLNSNEFMTKEQYDIIATNGHLSKS